jgi:hypothetical protein
VRCPSLKEIKCFRAQHRFRPSGILKCSGPVQRS